MRVYKPGPRRRARPALGVGLSLGLGLGVGLGFGLVLQPGCTKHECVDHPERCGARTVTLLSGPLAKRSTVSPLRFDIKDLSPLLPLEGVSAQLVQDEQRIDLVLEREGDSTTLLARVSATELKPLRTGRARLEILADRDAGSAPVWIIERPLYFDALGEQTFPALPIALLRPQPVAVAIETGKRALVLFQGTSLSSGKPVRKLGEYDYAPERLTGSPRGGSFLDDLDPASEAAVASTSVLILQPDGAQLGRGQIRVCSLLQPLSACANAPLGGPVSPRALAGAADASTFAVLAGGAAHAFEFSVDTAATPPALSLRALVSESGGAVAASAVALGAIDGQPGTDLVTVAPADAAVLVQAAGRPALLPDPARAAGLRQVLTEAAADLGTAPGALATGDLDGDGRADLVLAYGSRLVALLGLADGSFFRVDLPRPAAASEPAAVRAIAVGPLDADGSADVLVLRQDGALSLHRNPPAPAEHVQ